MGQYILLFHYLNIWAHHGPEDLSPGARKAVAQSWSALKVILWSLVYNWDLQPCALHSRETEIWSSGPWEKFTVVHRRLNLSTFVYPLQLGNNHVYKCKEKWVYRACTINSKQSIFQIVQWKVHSMQCTIEGGRGLRSTMRQEATIPSVVHCNANRVWVSFCSLS